MVQRSLAALSAADQVQDHRHLVHAHAGGGFVEHEHLGVQRDQQRHFQLALVAVRQRGGQQRRPCRPGAPVSSTAWASSIQALRSSHTRHRSMPPQPATAGLTRLHRQAHVLAHGEVGEQLRQLEGPAQAAPRAQRCRQAGDVLAVQQHLALHWPAAGR
jgi:hypothetical protein